MPRPQDDPTPRRTPWYWWALVNLLALCFAVVSWILALEIFGRPDVPSNYRILVDMDRAPEFKRYSPTGAPEGQVFSPPQLYGWFFDMGAGGHEQLNTLYRRNYMRNFDDAHAITYVEGKFKVLETRPFKEGDFLSQGLVVRAQALIRPDDFSAEAPYPVYLEMMVPTANKVAEQQFKPGSHFTLSRAPHLPVVMHVGRYIENDEPMVQVTVMPIGYGGFDTPTGMTIKLEVPESVDPVGRLQYFKPGS